MFNQVFIISVGIAFVIEIIHSILTKGGKFTLEFIGGGFLFGYVRELLYENFIQNYAFPDMALKLFGVPIAIPIGWVFTFYLAHEFINKLIAPKTEKDYKNFIIYAGFFSNFICIPIETAAMNMDWWQLIKFAINDNVAPVGLMGGWFYTSVVFFCVYFVAKKKLPRSQLGLAGFILLIVIVVEFELVKYVGLVGIALVAVGFLGILQYNKEITVISLIYMIIVTCAETFTSIPNVLFVTIGFTFIFIVILLKLRAKPARPQLKIKELL